MNILAIDPGTTESAYVLFEGGAVPEAAIVHNEELLTWLRNGSSFCDCNNMAIEMVASYGMAVGREVFETVLWIGRFQEAWEYRGRSVQHVFRRDVKIHLCGSMKAKDANIRQALLDRFGPVGTKKNPGKLYGISSHKWSALAVAVYAHDNPQPTARHE